MLTDVKDGRYEEALALLGRERAAVPAQRYHLAAGARAAAQSATSTAFAGETVAAWREVTRDFLHLAGVRQRTAEHLVVNEDSVLHVWPVGNIHAYIQRCGAAHTRLAHLASAATRAG